jgi:hypothetical protein
MPVPLQARQVRLTPPGRHRRQVPQGDDAHRTM